MKNSPYLNLFTLIKQKHNIRNNDCHASKFRDSVAIIQKEEDKRKKKIKTAGWYEKFAIKDRGIVDAEMDKQAIYIYIHTYMYLYILR